jgi:aspartate/methionine/tyrosine aminotransferase
MTTRTIQPTLDKALSRSPEYTQPSAELVTLRAEVAELLQRVAKLEARPQYAPQPSTRGDTVIGPAPNYSIWHKRLKSQESK